MSLDLRLVGEVQGEKNRNILLIKHKCFSRQIKISRYLIKVSAATKVRVIPYIK